MCGIFFLNEVNGERPQQAFDLGAGRGPESSNLTYNSSVSSWIGFHRLAINGLTANSDQPLEMDDCILICNGEIYNHKELVATMGCRTQTDSEESVRKA